MSTSIKHLSREEILELFNKRVSERNYEREVGLFRSMRTTYVDWLFAVQGEIVEECEHDQERFLKYVKNKAIECADKTISRAMSIL